MRAIHAYDTLVNDELPGDVDVFTSTLFLHHLKREEALRALTRMRDATRGLVLVNDLDFVHFDDFLLSL